MVRAVKPGGTIVVSDEIPNLTDRLLVPQARPARALDRWIVYRMVTKHLGRRVHRDGRAAHDPRHPGDRPRGSWPTAVMSRSG